jgi:hypothetical protein
MVDDLVNNKKLGGDLLSWATGFLMRVFKLYRAKI